MARVALQEIGSLLLRRSTPALSKQSPLISKRALSSTSAQHEDEEETVKWRNITIAGYFLCTALGIYNFTGAMRA